MYIEDRKDIPKIYPFSSYSDLALRLTLNGSNYRCLEHDNMAPKMFQLLRFDCMFEVRKEWNIVVQHK